PVETHPSFLRPPTIQHFIHRDRLRLVRRQLLRPRRALFRIPAGTGALKLGVARRLLTFRLAPVIPTLRTDALAHFTVEINRRSVRPPGPTKESRDIRLGVDRAVVEYEAERLILRRRGSRHEAAAGAMDVALLIPLGRAAEDEIRRAGDIAVL